MGITRFLKKSFIPGYQYGDAIKKVREHGLVDGIKEKVREDLLEDTPGVSHVYKLGKYEGKKDGYVEASCEYEDKILKQAEVFLDQTKDFESQKQEYEQLIKYYDKYIDEMSVRSDLSPEKEEYLQRMMIMERKLKKAMS